MATRSTAAANLDVIVIGAGHNGLVAACYLARAGLDVLVVEAADAIGGATTTAALVAEAPQHRFNACALDVCLMRASTVVADLELQRFGYQERDIDPAYVALDPDGGSLAIWRDPRRTADELGYFSQRDAKAYLEFARVLDGAVDAILPLMLTNPTRPAPRQVLGAALGAARHPRSMAAFARIGTGSAAEVIEERFSHSIVRGALAVIAGSGGTPIAEDGSASLLAFWGLFHRLGLGRPVGGTQSLPDALSRCLSAAGGTVRTAAPVEELLARGGRVTGVRLAAGEEIKARAVVASCDPYTTLHRLLPTGVLPDRLAARAARIPTTNSGTALVKIDLALGGRLELPRHQARRRDGVDLRVPAHLVGTLEEMCGAFENAAAGRLPDLPPFVSAVPTAHDPSQAPEGQDTLYLWEGWVPFRPSEGWESLAEPAAKSLVAHAGQYYEGIENLELGRFVETWPTLAKRIHATSGNPYHVDIRPFRMGPLRPAVGFAGYRTPVPGLFLTGAGTHPGPSVSGVPGQLAARTVLRTIKP
jgi:phytoene dehydrogenase-like protein